MNSDNIVRPCLFDAYFPSMTSSSNVDDEKKNEARLMVNTTRMQAKLLESEAGVKCYECDKHCWIYVRMDEGYVAAMTTLPQNI